MKGPASTIQGLDADGRAFAIEKLDAHRRGVRHVAVSAFVFDGDRLLLQRRALGKYHSGGQWANSCCSHPAWGESPAACVHRRVREELGLDLAFDEVGTFDYAAAVGNGLVENEAVHLFRAEVDRRTLVPRPADDEVMDLRWMTTAELQADIARQPQRYTPWLGLYLEEAWPLIARAA
ncbi:MAG: isopentenyl-diphosphate Delta-isomerase [Pseudomonadota bacterium]